MKKTSQRVTNSREMAGKMYRYFISYEDRGAPSFAKFARSVGVTVADLQSFRRRKRFEKAYRECQEIRRDYLIDRALDKRFDPSFVKFLISTSDEKDDDQVGEVNFHLEVSE